MRVFGLSRWREKLWYDEAFIAELDGTALEFNGEGFVLTLGLSAEIRVVLAVTDVRLWTEGEELRLYLARPAISP